jgi:phosphoribosylformimino-5-aminoimidazole carboxamide ribotide isomerase
LKIYPTLNIQSGRVVSTAGALSPSAEAPEDLAARLVEEGANRLALVDVDAALGKGNNRDLLGAILKRCRARERKVCVQVAGGIRSSDQAQYFLDLGANWLVAGTILHKSPLVSEQLMARFQQHLVAAIDARGGRVHRSGWVDVENLSALELAQRARTYGFRRLLFVDLPEEPGATPDFDTAEQLASATGLPLIMGGSLTTHAHLETLQRHAQLRGGLVDALLFREHPELQTFIQAANA